MTNSRVRTAFVLGTILASPALLAAQSAPGPKAKVSLAPSVEDVVAGRAFDVGVLFELQPEWHIYWKNSGDSGLPPVLKWSLPPGFSAGEPRFPVPRRHYSPGDIETNILAGEPMLLVEITPPTTINAEKVALAADVVYLVCAENCIREEAKVSAELGVRPSGAEPVPANQALFKRAYRALPQAASKYLEVRPTLSPPALRPGEPFEILLNVAIKPRLHIQSHKPALPSLIPAEVFVEKSEALELGDANYPDPKKRKDRYLGELTEYEGNFTIRVPGSVRPDSPDVPSAIAGVFAYQACNDEGNCFPPEAVRFEAKPAAGAAQGALDPDAAVPIPSATQNEGFDGFFRRFGIVGLLAACFLYGLFINATPCVLPLLSIKVLGFVQQAHESRRRTALIGLAFGAGVVVFFVLLGLLAARGKNILMYPQAVIVLGGVILALALSMLGVYTLQVPTAATSLEARIHSEGIWASFGKGALAPVLGFACTGPLLFGAWGWAIQQPPLTAILSFVFAGLGMASPYMLLGANPKWLSFLPRPGNWMVTFERIMGFLLLGMVVWMIHPLTVQIGATGLEWTLVFYVAIGVACWLLGRVKITMSDLERWRYRGAAATVIVIAAGVIYGAIYPIEKGAAEAKKMRLALLNGPAAQSSDEIAWRLWSPESVEQTVREGRIAFVDFTAAYCTVCKANKFAAIDTPEVREKLYEVGAVAFQADFSDGDPQIADVLQEYNRPGVPLNLIYPPGRPNSPIVLTPNLTKEYLLEKLAEAGMQKTAAAGILGRP